MIYYITICRSDRTNIKKGLKLEYKYSRWFLLLYHKIPRD